MKFALISFVLSAFIFSTFSVANPQKLNSVKPYSFYSSYKFNGEHGGGENLWLWKTDEGKIIGLFNTYAGPMDIEYGRESAVKDFKTDQKQTRSHLQLMRRPTLQKEKRFLQNIVLREKLKV
jgi:hypothetical protein